MKKNLEDFIRIIKKDKVRIFVLFILSIITIGCRNDNTKNINIPIVADNGTYIGDSILLNKKMVKLIFFDSTIWIDSIVFCYDNEGDLQSKKTFRKGREILENIYYHKNGSIKTYLFISSANENYFYRRDYNSNGVCIHSKGELFLENHYSKINPETREVIDDGDRMHIQVFYPKPPDCESFVFVSFSDSSKVDVFKQNEYIPFLKETWLDIVKGNKEWDTIDYGIETMCSNDTLFFENTFYYKVRW